MTQRPAQLRWLGVLGALAAACGPPAAADAGTMDASADAGSPDTGPPWTGPGCDPVSGIECDGDWTGRCEPACAASECCSPQRGEFACVARGPEGSCPSPNIWVDESQIAGGLTATEWRYFEPGDCAIREGCVEAAGWRRLLRFATWTPNTGDADLFLGVPNIGVEQFVYSACHEHYHFEGYAEYELRGQGGEVVADGHKQAFCLLDFYRYPGEDETGAVYDCDNQGIQRDWQDVYGTDLDCQWVDVTDVEPGDYTLRISLNTERALLESNYDDNVSDITVTVAPDEDVDVTRPCGFDREGVSRDCGFTASPAITCTPGEEVTLACSGACGLGTCDGDTVLRVCATEDAGRCHARLALGENDDSGCVDEDTCSQVTVECPASGSVTPFVGAFYTGDEFTCEVAATPSAG